MIEIIYDIEELEKQENGYWASSGFLCIKHGGLIGGWDIISGKWGRGTLPLGIYKIGWPVELEDSEANKSFKGDGIPWFAALIPVGKCEDAQGDRTDLGMHPDGGIEGTLGCSGVQHNDMALLNMLKELMLMDKDVRMKVC